jgi:hypothetical protein
MERRWAARAAARGDAPISEMTTVPTGERAAAEPQFPYGMCNAATAYASPTSTDVAAYGDLPGHHLLRSGTSSPPPTTSCTMARPASFPP